MRPRPVGRVGSATSCRDARNLAAVSVTSPAAAGLAFVKGHGTENDFILVPDANDAIAVTPEQVRAVCDRHAGLGADGVIRIAPDNTESRAEFVMDYRNADGSLAQMCGNGARVFARFLVDEGWVAPGRVHFRTRGGLRMADVPERGDVTIWMGPATVGSPSQTTVSGRPLTGVAVDVGNPHLACLTEIDLADLDLSRAPTVDDDLFPEGVNVEFVTVVGVDHVRMRVHERGVGETRSCGTGTVAAAAAYLSSVGRSTGTVTVEVPGGRVSVAVDPGEALLTGPVVLVARGVIDPAFWQSAR